MDRYTFFTDRDLGRRVPDALAAAGFSVERHDNHFEKPGRVQMWLSATEWKPST